MGYGGRNWFYETCYRKALAPSPRRKSYDIVRRRRFAVTCLTERLYKLRTDGNATAMICDLATVDACPAADSTHVCCRGDTHNTAMRTLSEDAMGVKQLLKWCHRRNEKSTNFCPKAAGWSWNFDDVIWWTKWNHQPTGMQWRRHGSYGLV